MTPMTRPAPAGFDPASDPCGSAEILANEIERRFHLGRDEPDVYLTPESRQRILNWLDRFSSDEILDALGRSIEAYVKYAGGQATVPSLRKAFHKIPSMVAILREERAGRPYLSRLLYIQGILRNRAMDRRIRCVEALEDMHLSGLSLDEMESRAKQLPLIPDTNLTVESWIDLIRRPA